MPLHTTHLTQLFEMDTTVTRYRIGEVTPSASRSIVLAVPPPDEGLHDHELMVSV